MIMSYADTYLLKNESVSALFHQIDFKVGSHMQDFIECIFVISGNGTHSTNNIERRIEPGSFLIVGNEGFHSITPDSYMEYYNILLRPEFFFNRSVNSSSVIDSVFITLYEEFSENNHEERAFLKLENDDYTLIESHIKSMHDEYLAKKPGYEKVTKSFLYIILTHIMRKMMLFSDKSEDSKLSNVLEYLNNHYNKKISVKELAKKSFYNPSYFSRLFKKATGKSMMEYIRELRIKNACIQLKNSQKSIDEIAADVGYSNPAKFFLVFKKMMGTTPQSYRKEFSESDFKPK